MIFENQEIIFSDKNQNYIEFSLFEGANIFENNQKYNKKIKINELIDS